MPNHHFQLTPCEASMRVLKTVEREARKNPYWTMTSLLGELQEEMGLSRATAHRYMRTAVDVLGIHYEKADRRRWQEL